MKNPLEYLDSLILSLENPSERPVCEVVCDFEEAITLSTTLRRGEDSESLIEAYSSYFLDPIPFEVEFFCAFHTGIFLQRHGELESADKKFAESMELAKNNGNLYLAARSSMALGVTLCFRGRFSEALVLMEKAEAGLRGRGG